MTQAIFFEQHETVETLPEGMRYREQLIAPAEEKVLIARVRELPFKEFEFHGHKGKRRTVSFGWQYEFAGRGALKKANDIPEFILPLRAIAAKFAEIEPELLQHVPVIEYGSGAGIGWHRDKPVFGELIGGFITPTYIAALSPAPGCESVRLDSSFAWCRGEASCLRWFSFSRIALFFLSLR